jgi:hypothetical protein
MADEIAAAREAWFRICRRGQIDFDDWLVVGKALVIGRAECFKRANTNKPYGRTYQRAMVEWLRETNLDEIAKAERSWVMAVVDNLDSIQTWRATLDDAARRRFNHPQAVLLHWRKSIGAQPRKRHVAKGSTAPRPPQHSPAVFWPQDMIKRAAMAMAERWSNDVVMLARISLEAAIRNQDDLADLLQAPGRTSAKELPAGTVMMGSAA